MNKNIKYSQNFLTSEKVLNQIIKQLNLKETDTVYEIGTGKGHLTTKLAKISKQVTSIELDSHLFNLSSEKLKLNTRVTLIHQDILQFQFPNKQRYKIVGSIPYHLSTQIISKNANHFYNEQHRQCQYLQYQLHRLNPFLLIILYKGICHNAMMSTLM